MVDGWLMGKKINIIVNAENLYNNLHVTSARVLHFGYLFIKF